MFSEYVKLTIVSSYPNCNYRWCGNVHMSNELNQYSLGLLVLILLEISWKFLFQLLSSISQQQNASRTRSVM
jgi:hypothetical protein